MRTIAIAASVLCLLGFSRAQVGAQEDDGRKSEANAAEYDLSIAFKNDHKACYKTSTINTSSRDEKSRLETTEHSNSAVFSLEWTGVDKEGSATVSQLYDQVSFKYIRDGVTEVEWDSQKNQLEDLEETWAPSAMIKDFPYTLTISPEGHVTKVDGFTAYAAAVRAYIAAEEEKSPEFKQFTPLLTDRTMADAVECNYFPLRKERVRVGDSWEKATKSEWVGSGELTFTRAFTFKEVAEKAGRKCAYLTLKGDITVPKDGLIQYSELDWTGEWWVDLETRDVVYATDAMKCTVVMNFGTTEVKVHSETVVAIELLPNEKDEKQTEPKQK